MPVAIGLSGGGRRRLALGALQGSDIHFRYRRQLGQFIDDGGVAGGVSPVDALAHTQI